MRNSGVAAFDSYIICTSPRSGSTLLCKLLEATGVAGVPGSHFHDPSISDWLGYYDIKEEPALGERETLEKLAATQHMLLNVLREDESGRAGFDRIVDGQTAMLDALLGMAVPTDLERLCMRLLVREPGGRAGTREALALLGQQPSPSLVPRSANRSVSTRCSFLPSCLFGCGC